MLKPLFVFLIVFTGLTMKMKINFEAEETRCFYQMLTAHQKYAVEITPLSQGYYQINIRHKNGTQWLHSVYRSVEQHFQTIKLHKVAKRQTLYSYCITNTQLAPLQLSLSMRFGLELLDLKVVVDESDQQMIEREARWIQKQTDKINQVVQNGFVKRRERNQYANLMRKKMFGYALVGLGVLGAISIIFYSTLKKVFKERKMI